MKKLFAVVFAIVLSFSVLPAYSGILILNNGDQLRGELKAILPKSLVWVSELVGEVEISKGFVYSIETSSQLKLRGEPKACLLESINGTSTYFNCSGRVKAFPLLTLKEVVLYENYEETTGFYSGKVSVVGAQTTGNKERQDWLASVSIVHRYTDYRHEYRIKYVGEAVDGEPLDEEYEGLYGFDWFFTPQTYWYLDVAASSDEARDVQEKYTFGTGLGYQFWESEKTAFSVKTGGVYINETYRFEEEDYIEAELNGETLDESSNDYGSWQLASDFRYLVFAKLSLFNHSKVRRSFNRPDEGEPTDWEVESDTGLSIPIAKGVTADVSWEYDYDNSPQDANSKEDTRLRFGLGYLW